MPFSKNIPLLIGAADKAPHICKSLLADLKLSNPAIHTVGLDHQGNLYIDAATYNADQTINTDLTPAQYQAALAVASVNIATHIAAGL
jgi:hypothetical protein